MHLHTIMKSGTSFLPCGNVEAHQTRNVQSPVCPTVKCNGKEEKNTLASQPHGRALLDPRKQKEEKEKKRKNPITPGKARKRQHARPKNHLAQPKETTVGPRPRPN